jgi:hypothetical protein
MHYLVARHIVERLLSDRPSDAAPVRFKPLYKEYANR